MNDICGDKCMGYDGNHGGCCTLYDRDYIIGPHHDANEFVERLKSKFGRNIKHSDIFIEYEEGHKLFPHLETWNNKDSYPALRVNVETQSKPCIFYNETIRRCMVHDIRPNTCRNYSCEYLIKMVKVIKQNEV